MDIEGRNSDESKEKEDKDSPTSYDEALAAVGMLSIATN